MIRALRYILLIVLALCLLTLALANRGAVTVKVLPDNIAVWEWLREHKHRATASVKTREVARLERELAVMHDTKPEMQDDVLALLERPGRRAG